MKINLIIHSPLILIAGAPPPIKLDKKKKLGSKPEPPVLDSVPASKVGAIYLSDASSPISQYSEKKKVETENNEHVSPQTNIQAVKVGSGHSCVSCHVYMPCNLILS